MELFKDWVIVQLRLKGCTWREIGRFFNVSAPAVCQRHKRIPSQAREFYRKTLRWAKPA